jgi:glycosyltransferase 2 family protein
MVTRGQDYDKIWNEFAKANYWWIILSAGISLLSHFVRSLRWRLLIQQLNFNPSVKRVFLALMTGYLANMVLPRVGELSRCIALKRTDKVPFNELVGTVIAERLFDIITVVILITTVILLQFSLVKSYLVKYIYNPTLTLVEDNTLIFAIIVVGGVFVFITAFIIIRNKFKKSSADSFVGKSKKHLLGVNDGVKSILKMKTKWMFLFYTVILWALYLMMVYTAFFGISSMAHLDISAALTILALGTIGIAIPVPGGIGTYHFVVITCLTELYFINVEAATSFAYISHASQMLVVIIFGGFAWFKLALKKSEITNNGLIN